MKTKLYQRKPFFVRARPVTLEDMAELAEWVGGTLETAKVQGRDVPYIKVPVLLPRRRRQGEAYVGDYIVASGTGFKVYQPHQFVRDFEPVNETDLKGAGLSDEQIALEMAKTREVCGGVTPETPVGPAAQTRFQFQTGLELDWNRKAHL